MVSGLREFIKKKQVFLDMIHQLYVEFPQDHEYAVQKIQQLIILGTKFEGEGEAP